MGYDQENTFVGWSGNHSKHPTELMDQIFTMTNDSINSLDASVKVIREDFYICITRTYESQIFPKTFTIIKLSSGSK